MAPTQRIASLRRCRKATSQDRLSGPLSRRALLSTGLRASTAAVSASSFLVACASPSTSKAALESAHAAESVPFMLWVVGIPINAASNALIQEFVDTTFNAKHKGMRAVWSPQTDLRTVVAAITAGSRAMPAIVAGCCEYWPLFQPFAKDIRPLLRRDNIGLDLWSTAQLHEGVPAGERTGGALYRLPANTAIDAFVYRQDILDELGLAYPRGDWNSIEAADLWRACTGTKGGQHRNRPLG